MTRQGTTTRTVHRETLTRIIELACRAPSVHNTQPWAWRLLDDGFELWADRARQLLVADPEGRSLTISCGAALHHAITAAQALGWASTIELMPDAQKPDFLASVRLVSAPVPEDAPARLNLLQERCTDRRRFTSWPIPDERVLHLAAAAHHWGAEVVALTDITLRSRVELLISRAMRDQARDPAFAIEERTWVGHSASDGIPAQVLPRATGARGLHPTRFDDAPVTVLSRHGLESSDGVLVIGTTYNGPVSWLHAGQTLSALWLQATGEGLSVVPLSQVIEVESTRLALQYDVLVDTVQPQMLVRIGWQEIGRSDLPRTPRRPLVEVLRS